MAVILTRLRELTSRDLGTGPRGVTPAAEHTSDGQQLAVNNPSPPLEAGIAGAEELRARGDICIKSSNFNRHSNGKISSPGSNTCCDEVENLPGKSTGDAI